MEQKIKIAVIGGTGKSGKYLVKQLLSQGFHFKILLRNADCRPAWRRPAWRRPHKSFQIKSPFIEVVRGDARDEEAIHTLIAGCQAVISTLGQPKGEPSIFSQATRNVLRSMDACHVQRYILTTGLQVDTPSDKKSPKTKFATDWMQTNYPETTADKQIEFNMLSDSDIDWTLVRLPFIEQTDERGKMMVSLEDCPGDKISATDLAHFLIEQLTDDAYVRKAPFIANV